MEAYSTLVDLGNRPAVSHETFKKVGLGLSTHLMPLTNLRFCRFGVFYPRPGGGVPDSSFATPGMILNITYGYTPKDCEVPFVVLADERMSATIATGNSAGAVLCDLVPARTLSGIFGAPW